MVLSLISTSSLISDSLSIDYYSPDNIIRFADYLYEQGDYQRAAGEYQRFLFATETLPVSTDTVLFKIGQSYRKNNDFDRAIHYFQNVVDNDHDPLLVDQAHYQIALSHFLFERFEQSEHYLLTNISDTISEMDLQARQLLAFNSIRQKRWDKASTILSNFDQTDITTVDILKFAHIGQNLPRKNKTLAGIYSTLIPGLGKFYCNRPVDGLQSLFSTVILGWQAYDGFHDDGVSSLKGWIFGTIGGLFYLGNIYGSVVAAELYNEQHEAQLMSKIKVYLNVHFD